MNRKILLFALLLYGLPTMADRLTIEHRYFGADRTEDNSSAVLRETVQNH